MHIVNSIAITAHQKRKCYCIEHVYFLHGYNILLNYTQALSRRAHFNMYEASRDESLCVI